MRRGVGIVLLVGACALSTPPMVAAQEASVDRVDDIDTVLAVAFPETFPVASLMRADCAFVVRVERPDGSAKETQVCTLSQEPVMVPAFQGSPPDRAFHFGGGACIWSSDYWFSRGAVAPVYAESFRYVVTPSGRVHLTANYSAEPLVCK